MSATECGFRSRYFFPQKPQCRIGQIYATKTTVKGGWYSSKTKKISLKCLVQLTSDYTNLSSVYICKNENGFCAKKKHYLLDFVSLILMKHLRLFLKLSFTICMNANSVKGINIVIKKHHTVTES